MDKAQEFCMIYATAPDEKTAEVIASAIVEKRLAACANIFPIQSIFRWKGKTEKSTEVAIILKTCKSIAQKCEAEIKKLHPYEVPCIVQIPIEDGISEFLDWIAEETKH
ncbi:MAG: divalent-cation tolerance protein CutA [Candidatus Thermoplasmatota archaeon]|nr:divalent-cation tolerance protein CutA [Candidatus Thermoplasmatota archaeon]